MEKQFNDSAIKPSADYSVSIKQVNSYKYSYAQKQKILS